MLIRPDIPKGIELLAGDREYRRGRAGDDPRLFKKYRQPKSLQSADQRVKKCVEVGDELSGQKCRSKSPGVDGEVGGRNKIRRAIADVIWPQFKCHRPRNGMIPI